MMKEKLTLFNEAKESRVLLNGILSTVIFFLIIIIGQFID